MNQVAAITVRELSRRGSLTPSVQVSTVTRGGSFRRTAAGGHSRGFQPSPGPHMPLSPIQNQLAVPTNQTHQRLSPQNSLLLAPPSQEALAQRRFSEVNAAIERHNSRRQAKRSQSVMYRNKRGTQGGNQRAKRTNSVNAEDADIYRSSRNRALPATATAAGQLNPLM